MLLDTKFNIGDKVLVVKSLQATKDPYDPYKQTVKNCCFVSCETIVSIRIYKDSEGNLNVFYYTDKSGDPYEEDSVFTLTYELSQHIRKILTEDNSNE